MIESKAWNWELIEKNDKEWTTPAEEVFYLAENWKSKGFKQFLDVGCGYGRNSIYFAKKGFEISGFDLSERSIEVTKENAENNNVKFKKLMVADMLNFPFENESFDCLLAFNVISHTDTKGFLKILDEIMRVLKPNGEAYFTLCSKESFWFNNPVCTYVDENTRIRVEDGPENGIPHFYINDDDCFSLFSKFNIIQIKTVRKLTKYGNFSSHYHIWIKK